MVSVSYKQWLSSPDIEKEQLEKILSKVCKKGNYKDSLNFCCVYKMVYCYIKNNGIINDYIL